MFSAQWDDLPATTSNQAGVPSQHTIENIQKNHFTFIFHIFGIRITLDGLQRIAALFGEVQNNARDQIDHASELVQVFKQ